MVHCLTIKLTSSLLQTTEPYTTPLKFPNLVSDNMSIVGFR